MYVVLVLLHNKATGVSLEDLRITALCPHLIVLIETGYNAHCQSGGGAKKVSSCWKMKWLGFRSFL